MQINWDKDYTSQNSDESDFQVEKTHMQFKEEEKQSGFLQTGGVAMLDSYL